MVHWDGRRDRIAPLVAHFRLSGWAFDVAPIGGAAAPRGDVLAIGPGGGLDALLALQYGARRFDGAEINPSIVALMSEPSYREKNGALYQQPEVHVATAEGRAFAREAIAAGRRYDVVFLALAKTATAGQGMAMVEAFIYTTNAFEDYLGLLTPEGQRTVVVDDAILLARFTVTALSVLRKQGIPEPAAMAQVAMMHDPRPSPYVFALVVQKSPFTAAQTEVMLAKASERKLAPIWIPGRVASPRFCPFPDLADGTKSIEQFVAFTREEGERRSGTGIDISPCPDDRPFVLDIGPTT
ncbi:MAG: hypothetical protein EXS13_08660 [Planctomycetes bacterium]|nr:hypothetical protein [Planctomycetota bacterium]